MINALAAAGAGFLLAVLWFDMMFDVQVRGTPDGPLQAEVLASISVYYRRVTTEAYPMNRLVALVMLIMLASIAMEIVVGVEPWWVGWVSIAIAVSGFVPTLRRTVPNARRLGDGQGTPEERTTLARSIFRDHRFSFVRMSIVLGLQLLAA